MSKLHQTDFFTDSLLAQFFKSKNYNLKRTAAGTNCMLEFERADAIVKSNLGNIYIQKDYLKYSVNTRDKKINKSTTVLNFVLDGLKYSILLFSITLTLPNRHNFCVKKYTNSSHSPSARLSHSITSQINILIRLKLFLRSIFPTLLIHFLTPQR